RLLTKACQDAILLSTMKNDETGDWLAMRDALEAEGYGWVDLRKCRSRGNGPPVVSERPVLYRWSDVLAWAQGRRRPHRNELGDTALGRWLAERETVHSFAARLELPAQFIHRLIGHRNSMWRDRLPPGDVLQLVSLETGIRLGVLTEDAVRVGMREVAE